MNKQISEQHRSSKNFLERFQGRTSTIGRAGLLSLLQQNHSPTKQSNEGGLSRYLEDGLVRKRSQNHREQRNPQTNRMSLGHSDQIDKRSSNQSFRTEQPHRRSQMGSMSNLGTTNRSSQKASGYSNKFALNVPIMSSVQLKTQRKSSLLGASNSNAFKTPPINSNSDDKFKHLQFLNLFEERMRKNRAK